MSIDVRDLSKTFGTFQALKRVSLTVATGELVALLGPSGSGKTTLLRIIAGLETPDDDGGVVLFNGQDITSNDVGERGVGFVFQHYALFRHMTVFENVAFGLRARPRKVRPGKEEIRERVLELLRLVQLEGFSGRHPSQLSGGQRQRVALARALAVQPRVLLLDEPFGALDAKVRRELRRWLRKLHDDVGITSVFVTHDQEEALEVADRVAVMNAGRIEQVGTPEEVYDAPASPFVYQFLGNVNLFHGRLESGSIAVAEPGRVRAGEVTYVRPHDVEVSRTDHSGGMPATVEHVGFAGAIVHLELRRTDNGQTVEAELSREKMRELDLKPGDWVFVSARRARTFGEDFSI